MKRKPLIMGQETIEQLQDPNFLEIGKLNIGPVIQVNLVSNTIVITKSNHSIYTTEGNFVFPAQLHTIVGGDDGDILILRKGTQNKVSCRDNTGNLRLDGHFTLDGDATLMLLKSGTVWLEISRANNG